MTVFLIFRWSLTKAIPSTPPGLRGGREASPIVYFLVISDSGIRTCLHLCSRFVGEERGVHTQVKQSLFPGLPYLAFTYSADRKLGGNLGARLISNIQVCYK